MTNGNDLTGFNEVKGGDTNSLDLNPTGQSPDSAFPATDKSTQDGSGLGNGGK